MRTAPTAPSEEGLPQPLGGSQAPGRGAGLAADQQDGQAKPQAVTPPALAVGSPALSSQCTLGAAPGHPRGLRMAGWEQAQPRVTAGEPHSELLPSSSWRPPHPRAWAPRRSLERGRRTSPALQCPRPRGHRGNTHISRPGSSQRPPALWAPGKGRGLEVVRKDVKQQLPGPDSPQPEQETGRTQGLAVRPCHGAAPFPGKLDQGMDSPGQATLPYPASAQTRNAPWT